MFPNGHPNCFSPVWILSPFCGLNPAFWIFQNILPERIFVELNPFLPIPKSFLQVIRALAPFLHSFRCLNPLFRSIIPSQFLCPDNPSPNSCSASYPSFKFRFCGYIRCLTPVYVQVKSGMGCGAQSVILLEFRFWEREKRNKRR